MYIIRCLAALAVAAWPLLVSAQALEKS